MRMQEVLALFGLAAVWGASFLFIRISSPVLGPFLTIQGRVTIAALVLLLYMVAFKQSLQWKLYWKQYLIIGALNAAIPFTLIATAAIYLDASMSAILNSLTPVFTALIVWGWMNEKVSVRKLGGIFLGMIGVGILVGWSQVVYTQEVIMAVVLSILSTVSYGFAGVYAKTAFRGVPPLALATGQQMGASILLLPFTVFNLPQSIENITPVVVVSVIGLALFCTAIAYLLYFFLIDRVGPTKTLHVTLLIPLFGVIWAVVFLGEVITGGTVLGMLAILASVAVISEMRVRFLPWFQPGITTKRKTIVSSRCPKEGPSKPFKDAH